MKNNKVLLLKLIVPFAAFLLISYICIYFAYKKIYTDEFIKNTLIEMDNTELVVEIESRQSFLINSGEVTVQGIYWFLAPSFLVPPCLTFIWRLGSAHGGRVFYFRLARLPFGNKVHFKAGETFSAIFGMARFHLTFLLIYFLW